MIPNIRDESGSALAITIIVLIILTILGASIAFVMQTEIRRADRYNRTVQSYYYALSGMEVATGVLEHPGAFQSLLDEGVDNWHFCFSVDEFPANGDALSVMMTPGTTILCGLDANTLVDIHFDTGELRGSITSEGRFSGITVDWFRDVIVREFSWTAGGSGNGAHGSEPIPPSSGTGNAGPINDGGLGWHDSGGTVTQGQPNQRNSDDPVIWDNGTVIVADQNSGSESDPFQAPAMFFLEPNVSLRVRFNMTMHIKSNFLAFMGNVVGTTGGAHPGRLYIYTRDSQIDGSQISGGEPGVKYGVIFFGDSILVGSEALDDILPNSYYYFPNGTSLISQSGTEGLFGADDLILIDDLENVNFDDLGYTVNTGDIADFDFGQFQ